jgi:hypothetical protein
MDIYIAQENINCGDYIVFDENTGKIRKAIHSDKDLNWKGKNWDNIRVTNGILEGKEIPIELDPSCYMPSEKVENNKLFNNIEDLLSRSFSTFVEGEDNSWKCKHNLKVLVDTIKGLIHTKDL